jgi:CheY-like chemotaxis protein
MEEFNLRQLCNELIQELMDSVGDTNIIKLSIDIQLGETFLGEAAQLKNAIENISLFISNHLINGAVGIEIAKGKGLSDHVNTHIQVAGNGLFRGGGPMDVIESEKRFAGFPFVVHRKATVDQVIFEFNVFLVPTGLSTQKAKPRFHNKKVLIAEDNEINAMVFASFLEEWGCEVTTVANGAEAVTQARDASFDAILIDIYMPILNGNKATAKIREFNTKVPIITLTASTDEGDIEEAKAAGTNDFLLKPVSSAHLFQVLSKYL